MATNITFRHYVAGATLTLELRPYPSGEVINQNVLTTIPDANDPYHYQCEISDSVPSGWYKSIVLDDVDVVIIGDVYCSVSDSGTYEVGDLSNFPNTTNANDYKADVSGLAEKTDLPDNFENTLINSDGHLSRVTLVDTTSVNSDMRGTDGAVTSLSGVAEQSTVEQILEDTGISIPASISALNDIDSTDVQNAAAAALISYDPPTRTEATEDKEQILESISELEIPDSAENATAVWNADERTLTEFEFTPEIDASQYDDLDNQLGNLTELAEGISEHLDLQDESIENLSDDISAVSSQIDSLPNASGIANAVWELAGKIDGKTPQEAMRYIAAVCCGLIPTGAGTTTEEFYGLDGTTQRVRVTVDENGNRTVVEYDPT